MQGASKQNCCTGGASPVAVSRDAPTKYVPSILSDSEVYFWRLQCTVCTYTPLILRSWPCDARGESGVQWPGRSSRELN